MDFELIVGFDMEGPCKMTERVLNCGREKQSPSGSGPFAGMVLIDTEAGVRDGKIHDFGACREPNSALHTSSAGNFARFISGAGFVCGRNSVHHDQKYVEGIVPGIRDKRLTRSRANRCALQASGRNCGRSR